MIERLLTGGVHPSMIPILVTLIAGSTIVAWRWRLFFVLKTWLASGADGHETAVVIEAHEGRGRGGSTGNITLPILVAGGLMAVAIFLGSIVIGVAIRGTPESDDFSSSDNFSYSLVANDIKAARIVAEYDFSMFEALRQKASKSSSVSEKQAFIRRWENKTVSWQAFVKSVSVNEDGVWSIKITAKRERQNEIYLLSGFVIKKNECSDEIRPILTGLRQGDKILIEGKLQNPDNVIFGSIMPTSIERI